jgi:uncharacterized phiE125 gp8 family phage protein
MDWTGYKIYAEPTVEPVTASDMKEYLRIASSETGHDTLLSGLITAARLHLERVTGRIFCSSTYDVQFASFADVALKLPVTPVQSITSITYKVSGVSATLAASQYELKDYGVFPKIVPAYNVSWPDCDSDSVIVRVLAGVAASPGPYDKMGIALLKAIVADLYEHPEQQSEISLTENKAIERLFNSYVTR